jgi:uncharacterized protein (DUF1697 family)
MARYALLLRGINVGGNKKIAMADLRELLGKLGFTEVQTLLQSGNAVVASKLSAAKVAALTEKGIEDAFGMKVRVLALTGAYLQAVIDAHPLADVADNGSRMLALFLFDKLDPQRLSTHDPATLEPGRIFVGDRVVYHWCPDGQLQAADLTNYLVKHHKATVTARNWNTVAKLAALVNAPS